MKRRTPRAGLGVPRHFVDPQLRSISEGLLRVARRVEDRGVVAVPGMSMGEILSTCGTVDGAGTLTVTFSEGTFSFRDGADIDRKNVVFRGQGHSTVLERSVGSSHAQEQLWRFRGEGVVVEGFRVVDSAGSGAAVLLEGNRSVVRNCVFEDCHQAVAVSGASGVRLVDNHVIGVRNSNYALFVTGASHDGVIAGNVIEQTGLLADIFLDSGCLRWVVGNNQTFGGAVKFTDVDGHSVSGNAGGSVSIVADENTVVKNMVFS